MVASLPGARCSPQIQRSPSRLIRLTGGSGTSSVSVSALFPDIEEIRRLKLTKARQEHALCAAILPWQAAATEKSR
jgi:hypothetical protein